MDLVASTKIYCRFIEILYSLRIRVNIKEKKKIEIY